MNKTKSTLIISSVIMSLAFVVAVVGVSAAWFGDMTSARRDGFVVLSDTLQDSASIDIESSKGMDGQKIYPAIMERGYLLGEGAVAPVGAVLKGDAPVDGVVQKAQVATVYFPIQYVGTPDVGYESENRKSLQIAMRSATIGRLKLTVDGVAAAYDRTINSVADDTDGYAGEWRGRGVPALTFNGKGAGTYGGTAFTYTVSKTDGSLAFTLGGKDYIAEFVDYKDEFNIEISLVTVQLTDDGKVENELSTVPTDTAYSTLTGDRVFYESVGYDTYLLLQPGVTYYVKTQIYFNKVDEECNIDLLNTVVRFNFKLNILDDGTLIRTRAYAQGGTND